MARLRLWTAPVAFATAWLLPCSLPAAQSFSSPRVQAIRYWSFGNVTRVAIQTDGGYRLKSDRIQSPPRLYFDLDGLRPPIAARRGFETIQVGDQLVKQIRVAQIGTITTRVVFDLVTEVEMVSSQLVNPDRLMIEVRPKGTALSALSIRHSVTGMRSSDSAPPPSLLQPPPTAAPAPIRPPDTSPKPLVTSPYSTETSSAGTTARQPQPQVVQTAMNTPAASAATAPGTSASIPPAPIATPSPAIAAPAKIDAGVDRSLVRVFGLKLGKVVIDPGHGGHDTGTIGPDGLLEKTLVLDVALRLGALIRAQLGADIVYTRSDDRFIALEDRTKIANDQKSDLFISIHANSSPVPSATGVETYYFNFTSDRNSIDLATRENATASSSISDLNDLLHRAVLQTKLEESRQFAQQVQTSLSIMSTKLNGKSKDRGVRQAPFVVLIGATMPSILAEVGFVSNPHDEKLMKRSEQRQKIAEALFKGVAMYASSLSHTQLARAGSKQGS
jgi:N-acetylmuramoyl-L-alanine amidase